MNLERTNFLKLLFSIKYYPFMYSRMFACQKTDEVNGDTTIYICNGVVKFSPLWVGAVYEGISNFVKMSIEVDQCQGWGFGSVAWGNSMKKVTVPDLKGRAYAVGNYTGKRFNVGYPSNILDIVTKITITAENQYDSIN
jgi:hypothetical protein